MPDQTAQPRRVLRLLHEVVQPPVPIRLGKRHRMLPVSDDQTALLREPPGHILHITDHEHRHIIPVIIQPIEQIHERRFDPADPQRLGDENQFLFHLSNPLFSGKIVANAVRSSAASASKSTSPSGSLMQAMSCS